MSSSLLFRRGAVAASNAGRCFSTSAARAAASIHIVGHLGAAPELRTTSDGRDYIKYSVASNSGPAENRVTSWFPVIAFVSDPQREYLLRLGKGSLVVVTGDARLNSYEDHEGKVQHGMSVMQRSIELLKRREQDQGQDQDQGHEQT